MTDQAPQPIPEDKLQTLQDLKESPLPAEDMSSRLKSLVLTCLKIGLTSFGAPSAHVAMMENEFVRKRKWITEEDFLDMLAAANLIPGPNASELAYHVGYVRAGLPGLFFGGLAFIFPAFLTSAILGWVYMHYGTLPIASGLFYFLNPLVLAVVVDTTWRIGKSSLVGWKQLLIFAFSIAGSVLGGNETVVLLGAGALGVFLNYALDKSKNKAKPLSALLPLPLFNLFPSLNLAVFVINSRLLQIFLYFLKTGFILFGSSMVLFGLVQNDIVHNFGWLTQQQLVDAIVVGQVTPGPVLSSASFMGYIAGGFGGAALATLGVFLPGFTLVAITAPILSRLRESAAVQAFLRGVNASVVALILLVAINLGRTALSDPITIALFVVGFFVLFKFQVTPVYLVISGMLLGIIKTVFLN